MPAPLTLSLLDAVVGVKDVPLCGLPCGGGGPVTYVTDKKIAIVEIIAAIRRTQVDIALRQQAVEAMAKLVDDTIANLMVGEEG
ncbi:MAG: hypothetical protein KA761_00345 [Gemmatimonadaceae bacterium]|nr:hypothetical protein [Gemmatimonadaceae bacterium]